MCRGRRPSTLLTCLLLGLLQSFYALAIKVPQTPSRRPFPVVFFRTLWWTIRDGTGGGARCFFVLGFVHRSHGYVPGAVRPAVARCAARLPLSRLCGVRSTITSGWIKRRAVGVRVVNWSFRRYNLGNVEWRPSCDSSGRESTRGVERSETRDRRE